MTALEKALKTGRKIAGAGLIVATALLPVSNAKADLITITNKPVQMPENSIVYPVTIESNNPLSSKGYDINDNELNTSESTFFNYTAYEKLNTHKVDYNSTPEPQIGDIYTLNFGVENKVEEGKIVNILTLSNYTIDNTNGVNDYQYTLKIGSNADKKIDIIRTGLLSDVWESQNKTIGGSWEQTLPFGTTEYGELTLTASPDLIIRSGITKHLGNILARNITVEEDATLYANSIRADTLTIGSGSRVSLRPQNESLSNLFQNFNSSSSIPEPATSTLLVGAGLALGAGYVASQLKKKK